MGAIGVVKGSSATIAEMAGKMFTHFEVDVGSNHTERQTHQPTSTGDRAEVRLTRDAILAAVLGDSGEV